MPPTRDPLQRLLPEELARRLHGTGRARQVWQLLRDGHDPFAPDALSKPAHQRLLEHCIPGTLPVRDTTTTPGGTTKFLFALPDGLAIETVIIPGTSRTTVCVSTQVGCARDCSFCATATMGLLRSLQADEIVAQVCQASAWVHRAGLTPVQNVVFMGMGEPLDNFSNVRRATQILIHPHAFRLAPRRLTLSTVGTSPRAIERLTELPVSLAWSLHTADDEKRRHLIPTTRYPLNELRRAFLTVIQKRRAILFVEMTLIDGVNDTPNDAQQLATFLEPFAGHVRINLLTVNSVGHAHRPPTPARLQQFRSLLNDRGYFCMIRRSRGQSANAACGQLATMRP